MKSRTKYLSESALIAALYAVLTILTMQFSSSVLQVRLAEALTLLPVLTPAAIPGLFVGCLIANLFTGNVWDILLGSLLTLTAALLTRFLSQKCRDAHFCWLWALPAPIINALGVPLILYYGYGLGMGAGTLPVLGAYALSVFIGEVIACLFLGIPLYFLLRKKDIFK